MSPWIFVLIYFVGFGWAFGFLAEDNGDDLSAGTAAAVLFCSLIWPVTVGMIIGACTLRKLRRMGGKDK